MGRLAGYRGRVRYSMALWVVLVLGVSASACGGAKSGSSTTGSAAPSSLAPAGSQPATPGATQLPCQAPGSPCTPMRDPGDRGVVANVGPTALVGSAGRPFNGLIVSVASGPCGCEATVDWGDGSNPSRATAKRNHQGGVDVTGSHTYQSAGTYGVVATVVLCEYCIGSLYGCRGVQTSAAAGRSSSGLRLEVVEEAHAEHETARERYRGGANGCRR